MWGEHILWEIARRRAYFKYHIQAYVYVNLALLLFNLMFFPGIVWCIWVAVFWAPILLAHGWIVKKTNEMDMKFRYKKLKGWP